MSETKQEKSLARHRFLALLGTSALGLWLLQLMPSGLSLLKLPVRRRSVSSVSAQVASRVKIHPQAVKREIPVNRETRG